MGQKLSCINKRKKPTISSIRQQQEQPLSRFYVACHDGDIELVERLLPSMTIEQIDSFEPNGSTALHAASYYGHKEIVRLLLLAGATRSLRNLRYNLTAYEEAHNDDIRRLFARINLPDQARFIGSSSNIEWSLDTSYAPEWKIHLFSLLQPDLSFQEIILFLQDNYLKDYVKLSSREMEKIILLFRYAYDENDARYIVQAYTSGTKFYAIINNHFAEYLLKYFRFEDNQNIIEQCVAYLASIFIHRLELRSLSYIGIVYRGLLILQSDLEIYTENKHLLNKSFLSTSKERNVASMYAGSEDRLNIRTKIDKTPLQFTALCIYKIRNSRTALDISSISEIPHEYEVLIMPLCAFYIQSVVRNDDNNNEAQFIITLEECNESMISEEQNIQEKTRPRVT